MVKGCTTRRKGGRKEKRNEKERGKERWGKRKVVRDLGGRLKHSAPKERARGIEIDMCWDGKIWR